MSRFRQLKAFPQLNLFTQTADKTIQNTNAETSLFGTGVGSLTIPANLCAVGKSFIVTMAGYYAASIALTTFTLKLKANGAAIATSDALLLAGTSGILRIDALMTIRSIGVTGTVVSQGTIFSNAPVLQSIFNASPVTVDTTSGLAMDVTGTFSIGDPTNIAVTQLALLEVVSP